MNELETSQLLTAAKVLDPRFVEPDDDGFVLRLWHRSLDDVPMEAAEEALREYYRSPQYRETRDSISPADIVQWHKDRRRYAYEIERKPVVPEQIHAGVDRVFAALAERKALAAGEDPDMALDIAEGETAVRREYRARKCGHCGAEPGQPCVDHRGRPLTKSPAHDSRMAAVEAKARGDADTATAEMAIAIERVEARIAAEEAKTESASEEAS